MTERAQVPLDVEQMLNEMIPHTVVMVRTTQKATSFPFFLLHFYKTEEKGSPDQTVNMEFFSPWHY